MVRQWFERYEQEEGSKKIAVVEYNKWMKIKKNNTKRIITEKEWWGYVLHYYQTKAKMVNQVEVIFQNLKSITCYQFLML